jgi:HEAT repeat protein
MGIFNRKPNLGKLAKKQDISSLVKILKSKNQDNETRQKAASVLGQIGPVARAAIPALTEALKDSDTGVRGCGAFALGGILNGSDLSYYFVDRFHPGIEEKPALDGLLNTLKDEDRDVRKFAAMSLGLIGKLEIATTLCDVLKTEEDSQVRGSILIALGLIGDQASIPILINALRDDDNLIRECAASGLERFGSSTMLSAALRGLPTDERDTDRDTAAWVALGKVNAGGTMDILVQALKHSDPDVRLKAVTAINLMSPNIKEAAIALIGALEDDDQRVRKMAASALEAIGPDAEAAIPSLAKLLGALDKGVRSSASLALSSIGSVSAVNAMIEAIQNEATRDIAIAALGRIGPTARPALPSIIEALNDKSDKVRRSAIDALLSIGGNEVVAPIVSALDDIDAEVRSKAAIALGEIGNESALPALEKNLKDIDNNVRIHAHASIVRITGNTGEHVRFLVKALKDKTHGTSVTAAEALAKVGPAAKGALPTLYSYLETDNLFLQQALLEAIRKITGRDTVAFKHGVNTSIWGPPIKIPPEQNKQKQDD